MKKTIFLFLVFSVAFASDILTKQDNLVDNLMNEKKKKQINYRPYQEQSLIYTKKHPIEVGKDKGMLIYTYLNPLLKKSVQEELFILSIAPKFLKTSDIRAIIEGEEAFIEPLDENAPILKLVFKNEYAKYYLITTSKTYNKNSLKTELCVNKQCFALINQKQVKALFFRSEEEKKD